LQVDVPFDFHRSIIGQKGKDVRELMEKYDVHIVLSPADQRLDIIKVSYFVPCSFLITFLKHYVPIVGLLWFIINLMTARCQKFSNSSNSSNSVY
jgi:hypothetical protein